MIATISVRDFRAGIQDWLQIRRVFNHQESGLETNRCDVELFAEYLRRRRIGQLTSPGGASRVLSCGYQGSWLRCPPRRPRSGQSTWRFR